MIFVNIIIIVILTTLGTYFADKIPTKSIFVLFIPTFLAVIGYMIVFSVGSIEKYLTKPNVVVSTKKTERAIDFYINVDNQSIDSIYLSYHILGNVIDIQCTNPESDVSYTPLVSDQDHSITNQLELSLINIKPNKKLHFTVYYTPLNKIPKISFLGSDRYEINYKWIYKGEKFFESQWRLAANDKLAQPLSGGIIGNIQYSSNPKTSLYTVYHKRNLNSETKQIISSDEIENKIKIIDNLYYNKQYEEALKMNNELILVSKNKYILAILYGNNGVYYASIGKEHGSSEIYKKAIENYNYSLLMLKEIDIHQRHAELKTNLGSAYCSLANYENRIENIKKAVTYWEESIKVLDREKRPDEFIKISSNISLAKKEIEKQNSMQK